MRELHLGEHNHAHLKIFRQPALNELLGWMCFLSNGCPLECYELHRVQNHHRNLQRFDAEKLDWSSAFGFAGTSYPDKPMHRVYYCLTYALLAWLHCMMEVIRRPGLVVYVGIGSNNYEHHEDCKLTTPYDSAMVDLRFPHWLFGYHVKHHVKPTLHRSLLPRYHRTLEPLIPAENYVIPPPGVNPRTTA